ncbi:MAG: TetR/AcrR family transcriptional regulator [Actinomycetota bacterium]
MNRGAPRTRPVGRPPGPHDDTLGKLLPTALRLFLAEGAAALTPTRLHRETGVARATIYRNWPDPADLIEIMLQRATGIPEEMRCEGDPAADLHAALDLLLFRFEHRPVRPFLAACLQYGDRSERLGDTARAFVDGILAPFHLAIRSGIEHGRITPAPGVEVDDLVAELTGPLIVRHVLIGEPVDTAKARRIVDEFVARHVSPDG